MSIKFINKGRGKTKLLDETKFQSSRFTTFNIHDFDTSEMTSFTSFLTNCKQLINADCSNFINSSIENNCGSMFSGCTALTSVDFSNNTTTNTLNIIGMFNGCTSLTSVDFTNSSFASLSLSNTFKNCKLLTEIDLSNITLSNTATSATSAVANMFDGCSALITVDIGHLDLSNYTFTTSTNEVIKGCTNLSNASLNSILKALSTSGVNIPAYKTLQKAGFTEEQANIAVTLSNWQLCVNAGWTTGY